MVVFERWPPWVVIAVLFMGAIFQKRPHFHLNISKLASLEMRNCGKITPMSINMSTILLMGVIFQRRPHFDLNMRNYYLECQICGRVADFDVNLKPVSRFSRPKFPNFSRAIFSFSRPKKTLPVRKIYI